MTWTGRNRGCINLHGHVHTRPNDGGYDANLKYWDNQLDVGVDARDYKPVSLEEVLNILENKKEP